jgi:hypothetical protein
MKKRFSLVCASILTVLFYVFVASPVLATTGTIQIAAGTEKKLSEAREPIRYVPFPDELKQYEVYPWEILSVPRFKKSYRMIIGSKLGEKWLKLLDGPSNPNKLLATRDGKLVVVKSCKPHWCDTHLIVILYDPVTNQSWGYLRDGGATVWLGNPDDALKTVFLRILRSAEKE